jgi:hypothetical protein
MSEQEARNFSVAAEHSIGQDVISSVGVRPARQERPNHIRQLVANSFVEGTATLR